MATAVQQTNTNGLFPASLTPGNTILFLGVAYDNDSEDIGSSLPTINGASVTGSQLQQENSPLPSGELVYESIWMVPDNQNTGTQLGLTFTGNQQSIIGVEFAGLGANPVVDVSAISGNGDSAGPAAVGPLGPISSASGVVFAGSVAYGIAVSAPASPWTGIAGNNDYCYAGYQLPSSSGGDYTWSTSLGGTAYWSAGIVAVKPSGNVHTSSVNVRVAPAVHQGRAHTATRSVGVEVQPSIAVTPTYVPKVFAADDVAIAAWTYIRTFSDVQGIVGTFPEDDPNGFAGLPYLFTDNLLVQMKGSQTSAVVFNDAGGWQAPPQYGSQRFRRLRVDVWTDPLRDASDNIVVTKSNTVNRCLQVFNILHRHLQRRDSDIQVWGDMVTYGCQLLTEPNPDQVPDGDSQGMGLIMGTAFYGVCISGWTDFSS
jgi:hypothetical protein